MIRKTGLYTFFGWVCIISGAYVLISSSYKLSQTDMSSYGDAIITYVLESQIVEAVSAMIIGGLLLGFASVIKQNNAAAMRFDELNRKLDSLMCQKDSAPDSENGGSTYDQNFACAQSGTSTPEQVSVPYKSVSNWELWAFRTHLKVPNVVWLGAVCLVFVLCLLIYFILK